MSWLGDFFSIWREKGMMGSWWQLFVIAFAISFFLVPVCRSIGIRYGLLDYPDKRKVHLKPVPRLGGVAIYLAFVLTLFLNFHFSWQLKGVLLASTLMFVVGLLDDIYRVSAMMRLGVQIIAVGILILFDVSIDILPPHPFFNVLEWGLTLVWVLGITNAFNFMDGLNGLAAGLGEIACLAFLFIANASGQPYLGFLAAAMGGACLGFLRYNFHKASIFMGDSGSTLIGFFLASLGIMGEWSEGNLIISIACPILILALFIYDMIYITAARTVSGKIRNFKEWIEYTGKDHLHHRLIDLGLTPTKAVLVIYFMSALLAVSAIKIRTASISVLGLEFLQVSAILILISILMLAGRRVSSHKKIKKT